MSKEQGLIRTETTELINALGLKTGFDEFYTIIKAQCFGGKDPSHAHLSSFLVLASTYKLNPLLKEIYAFPSGGGIQPIISIDGWLKIAHSSGKLRGIKHDVIFDKDNNVTAVKCTLSVKDWDFPVETLELMSENKRNTPTWKQYPLRMLKHRATTQAIRMAFNVNAMLEDEFQGWQEKDNKPMNDDQIDKRADLIFMLENLSGIEEFNAKWKTLSIEDMDLVGDSEYKRLRNHHNTVDVQ